MFIAFEAVNILCIKMMILGFYRHIGVVAA